MGSREMIILGYDFETNSLDTENCDVLEIGIAKLDTDYRRIFNCGSIILQADTVTEEAMAVNGLKPDFLAIHGIAPKDAFLSLWNQMEEADYICAHNGNNFDKLILQAQCMKWEIPLVTTPSLDTRTDCPYPESFRSKSLLHLAAEHDIYFPKRRRHGALHDVLVMLEILDQYDIKEVIKRSESPTIRIGLTCPYDENDFPKSRRYRWDSKKKIWTKEIKAFELEAEKKASKFEIQVVE